MAEVTPMAMSYEPHTAQPVPKTECAAGFEAEQDADGCDDGGWRIGAQRMHDSDADSVDVLRHELPANGNA